MTAAQSVFKKTKGKRCILACLVLLAMLCAVFPVAAAGGASWDGSTVDTSWYTGGGPYSISTGAQLAGLAALVNAGEDFSGKTVLLTQDIDLGAKEWMPIGAASITITPVTAPNSQYEDSATLDGTGHHVFSTGL